MDDNPYTSINTTAILFGNINEKGQLEADDQDLIQLNKLENCHLTEFNEKINDLLTDSEAKPEECMKVPDNVATQDYYDETEAIDESILNNMIDTEKLNKPSSEENYDDDDDDEVVIVGDNDDDEEEECVIVDDSSLKMPPPTKTPTINQNKCRTNQTTAESFINLESQLERTNNDVDPNNDYDLFQNNQNENNNNGVINNLNTPLGRILPPEYVNVDITTLFPHYHPDKIPRWSKLFKPFHEHQMYKQLDMIKANRHTTENGILNNNTNSNNNRPAPVYRYDSRGVNLGEEAPPEMIQPDQLEQFRQAPKSFADIEIPLPFKDMNIDNISQNYQSYPPPNNNNNSNNNQINPNQNNKTILPKPSINPTNVLNNSQSSFQKRMKMQQESIASRKKRKREEKLKKEENSRKEELLIGLSWRDGPAKYWYDLFEIPETTNILDYKIETNLHNDDSDILPNIVFDPDDDIMKLHSWQLYNWEDEIIVDPSNHKKEVIDSNRKYAPYAGWIPSYKHRNMATFQDAFSSEYFGIWPSSSMGTTLQKPNPSQWRSIFAPENLDIICEDWASLIITDPRQEQAQKPYLLELDLNNEHIHFDFTKSDQTLEILTSELNDVTLNKCGINGTVVNGVNSDLNNGTNSTNNANSTTCDNQNSESQQDTTDTTNANTQNTTDTPNKDEKQLKKMKILSKLNADNVQPEVEEKPKEEIVEDVIDEKFKISPFSSLDTYQLVQESERLNIFNIEIQENNLNDNANTSTLPSGNTGTIGTQLNNPAQNSLLSNNNPLAAITNFTSGNSMLTAADLVTHPDIIAPLISNGIQHSLSAIKLDPFLFPLKIDNQFLRFFHRPRLSDIKNLVSHLIDQILPIYNLKELLETETHQRQKIREITGNGDLFFMRSINDLSSCFDHLVFAEYSEEYPPLVKQNGMASRIVNYYCGNPKQTPIMPELQYGELMVTPQIPFLGQIQPHQIFQAIENNMFRSPLYLHQMKPTDFLVVMKSNSIHVRRVRDIFTVGQQLPLMEVPAPNSKKANTFLKDFLQVQIIRLFLQSESEPKKIRHDEVKMLLAEQSDSALKKRLKAYAEYKKAETSNVSGYWILKPEFQLPTEDELLECITPEECCAYYSMMWGLCRLEDAGYNSRTLTQDEPEQQQDDDDDKDNNLKIEDEVKAAPWHTTKSFIDAQKGKCYLELNGSTDPTGIGEGFSYSRVSTKASLFKETLRAKGLTGNLTGISSTAALGAGSYKASTAAGLAASILNPSLLNANLPNATNSSSSTATGTLVPGVGKRMVTGTDADLRKLTLKEAHALLQKNGIPEHYVKKMKRWDIIDLVREMSTQKAKQGEEEGMTKFARSSRLTVADQEERYKQECQRIFTLQNRVLSNDDELTSDDGGSDDDDGDGTGAPSVGRALGGGTGVRGGGEASQLNVNSVTGADDLNGNMETDIEVMRIKKSLDHVSQRRNLEMSETNSLADGGDNSNFGFPKSTGGTGIGGSNSNVILPACSDSARSIMKSKAPIPKVPPKALCIRRYIDSGDGTGTKIMQPQTIPWSYIVKIYFKINEEHNSDYLKEFCGFGNQSKEEDKKNRKKQQEQVRRIKQKQKAAQDGTTTTTNTTTSNIKKKYKPKLASTLKKYGTNLKSNRQSNNELNNDSGVVNSTTGGGGGGTSIVNIVCGACGNKGHMRTNKECPMYGKQTNPIKKKSYKRPYPRTNNNAGSTKTIKQLLSSTRNKAAASGGASGAGATTGTGISTEGGTNLAENSSSNLLGIGDSTCNLDGSINQDGIPYSSDATVNQTNIEQDEDDDMKLFIPKTLISQCSTGTGNQDGKMKIKSKKSLKESQNTSSKKGNAPNKVQSKSVLNKANEYILEQKMKGNRRRIDPTVALNHQFEEIYRGFLQIPGYRWFLHPVKRRDFPNYYDLITKPMDLSQVKMNINENYYQTRESFIQDIKLIYDNCCNYNGKDHEYSVVARQLISHVMEQFCAKERKLMRLERLVNPLMDEDDMVGMKFILEQVISAMEEVEHSRPFHLPVDRKRYTDYADKIAQPMDLATLRNNVKQGRYRSRNEFMTDANLIVSNCAVYNGENNILTAVAHRMIEIANEKFQENEEALISLEANLKLQYEEDASDSQMAGSSCMTDHLSHIGDDNDAEISNLQPASVGNADLQRSSSINDSRIGEGGLEEERQQVEGMMTDDDSRVMMDQSDDLGITRSSTDADWDKEPDVKRARLDQDFENDESIDDITAQLNVSSSTPPPAILATQSSEAQQGRRYDETENENEAEADGDGDGNMWTNNNSSSGGCGTGNNIDASRERLMLDLRLTDSEGSGSDCDLSDNQISVVDEQHDEQQQHHHHIPEEQQEQQQNSDCDLNLSQSTHNSPIENDQNMQSENTNETPNVRFYISDEET